MNNNITLTKAHVPFALTCNTFDGNSKTITLSAGYDFSLKPVYGGFFSEFSGTLKDLTMAGPDVSFSTGETANMKAFGLQQLVILYINWKNKGNDNLGATTRAIQGTPFN